eukprot:scaffold1210_cov410-Prasinococcus_capsulatus_cf.AAC.5
MEKEHNNRSALLEISRWREYGVHNSCMSSCPTGMNAPFIPRMIIPMCGFHWVHGVDLAYCRACSQKLDVIFSEPERPNAIMKVSRVSLLNMHASSLWDFTANSFIRFSEQEARGCRSRSLQVQHTILDERHQFASWRTLQVFKLAVLEIALLPRGKNLGDCPSKIFHHHCAHLVV